MARTGPIWRVGVHRSPLAALLAILAMLAAGASVMIPQAANAAGSQGFFHALSGRLLDTRLTNGPWTAGTWHTVTPNGQLGLPTTGVTALSVTLTSVSTTAGGYVTALPASATQQHPTSMLQWNAGDIVSNSAIIATDSNGAFQVYASTSTQLIVDVQGYFSQSSTGSAAGGFTALPNGGSRLFDSRASGAPSGNISPGSTYTISGATASSGVPATATALFANITVISYVDHDSYITAWPTGTTRPNTSLNYVGDGITAIGSVVSVNASGQFNVYLSAGAGSPIDIVIDIQGYYSSASTPGGFTPQDSRLYDTRADTTMALGTARKVQVAALGGIPSTVNGVAAEVINVKVISNNASDSGFLRIWGTNQAEPNLSDINVDGGSIRSNLVTVVPGADNSVWVRYRGGPSSPIDVVIDSEGWYASSSTSTVAGAPQSVTASATDSTATVSFTPPASDGGAEITSYTVTANPNGQSISATGSPIVFPGLANGTSYTFTVAATNSAGTGPSSDVSNVVTPHAIANTPGAPQSVGATAGDASATVSFSAPASNSGAAITSYKVTSSPGGKTASGSGSPITVTGLTNLTVYTFTVTATNSAGTGPASTPSRRVTPKGPVGATNSYPCLNSNRCWGVDTVDKIDKDALDSIKAKWGRQPDFVGQYLNFRDTNYNVTFDSGLATTLHDNNVGIIMIQDEGYCSSAAKGTKYADDANNAALDSKARPNTGVYIFMDIEINDTVVDSCITSYVTQLEKHGFEPGFYENPLNGDFPTQYCQAVSNSAAVKNDVYLWSATPSGNTTTAAGSPTFNPNKPSCTNNTTAWQYALAAGSSFNYDEDEIAPDRRSMLY